PICGIYPSVDRRTSPGQPAAAFPAGVRSLGVEAGQRRTPRHGLPRTAAGTGAGRAPGVAARAPCAPQPPGPARDGGGEAPAPLLLDTTPLETSLRALRPLEVQQVRR